MANVFQYIASHNPGAVVGLINKYGYQPNQFVKTNNDLAISLRALVNKEGEPAFMDMMELHPDKDMLVELYGKPQEKYTNMDGSGDNSHSGCNCRRCRNNDYSNADGSSTATGLHFGFNSNLTGVAIVAASLLLATAIITRNK